MGRRWSDETDWERDTIAGTLVQFLVSVAVACAFSWALFKFLEWLYR